MMIPTIHLNGTSRERLLEAIVEANNALIRAQQAVAETAPNARDYPQGYDALRKAQNEHWARMQKLIEVRQELEDIAEAICDQGARR